jgi:putative PEP-CTERM system histidine kinase
MNLGLYSYLAAALAYGVFALLLLFSWRQSLQGKLLFIAVLVSACWSIIAVKIALHDKSYLLLYQSFEIIRYIVWYIFLLKLFDNAFSGLDQKKSSYQRFIRWSLPLTVSFAIFLLFNELMADVFALSGQFVLGLTGNVMLALIGLAILEQLFRNMSAHFRWATKYLFLAAGGLFAYDFYLYADALLFRSIDQYLWEARGVVHLVAVPLLAIASVRNKNWSLNIFVSRDIVLNTTAILVGGGYLLVMAGMGYYLRDYGGTWGKAGQVIFITIAVVFLFVVLSSSQFRAHIKVFLGKHFYKNKYDYRIEWLRLTQGLNDEELNKDHYQLVIQAIAQIVQARSGQLWLINNQGQYNNKSTWQSGCLTEVLDKDDSLIEFLDSKGFVINLLEIESRTDEYNGLDLPEWLSQVDRAWLIIPLHGTGALLGFIVLADPLVIRQINWEDRDLLKAAAKQISSYLIVLRTSAQLAEAKQFEVFSRLSAYMVHDLKNISAELELVAINAKKHAENPAFIEDAFETIENASCDINRLLEQLRTRRVNEEKKARVDLVELVQEVVVSKQHQSPAPCFEIPSQACVVTLEKGRFSNVLAHLIDNAQQATGDGGGIVISLSYSENTYLIEIKDTGHGMDEDFIRDRLFKPFDTTKGNAGMGIGMFESREYIRQLGGDIRVQSKPGKGSIITIHIPSDASSS